MMAVYPPDKGSYLKHDFIQYTNPAIALPRRRRLPHTSCRKPACGTWCCFYRCGNIHWALGCSFTNIGAGQGWLCDSCTCRGRRETGAFLLPKPFIFPDVKSLLSVVMQVNWKFCLIEELKFSCLMIFPERALTWQLNAPETRKDLP